jgi:dienelactone hydrolase
VYKYLAFLMGCVFAIPILGLIALAFGLPITFSGAGYLFASFIFSIGLLMAPWKIRHHLLFTIVGLFTLILIASVKIILGKQTSAATLSMITLPQVKQAHWLSYIIDEQDSLIFGETLFHFIGGSSASEHKDITQALHKDYASLRQAQGMIPSPIINTYLGLQRPGEFDAIIIEPETNVHPEIGIIFLHGYMGNVTAQCWEIARAVSRFGAVTVCPSTGWRGEWWRPEGQAIIEATFDYLRGRSIKNFYLGGFSNGGFSINRLAPQLRNEDDLIGLFLIDGIYDGLNLRETGLPILVIQGTQDERVPAAGVRQIVKIIGAAATYVEIDSDHFLIMKQPDEVQVAIQTWLENHQPDK